MRQWIAGTLVVMALGGASGAGAQESSRALRLLRTVPLPRGHSIATDIRWSAPDSVFVSWESDGVAEVSLDGAKRRELVPGKRMLGLLKHYDHLGISGGKLAVASINWGMAWRPFSGTPGGKVLFQSLDIPITLDFDLLDDRIVLLGLAQHARESNPPRFAPQGEVAWIGTLAGGPKSFRPVLKDAGGAGAPHLEACDSYPIGAARFLPDGSFVVAPGFQSGIHLFDAQGKEIRSWTSEQVGIDGHTVCSTMTEAEAADFAKEGEFFERWLNSHRTLDDVLPLPQGPGVLVRSWGADRRAHWTLKVLRPDGVTTYEVPVQGRRPFDRLRGDVRDGRIAFLLSDSAYPYPRSATDLDAEIYLMEFPK